MRGPGLCIKWVSRLALIELGTLRTAQGNINFDGLHDNHLKSQKGQIILEPLPENFKLSLIAGFHS